MAAVISKLAAATNHADRLSNQINDVYRIDNDDTVIATKTIKLKEELSNTKKYLETKVLPAISSAIIDAKQNIEYLENNN